MLSNVKNFQGKKYPYITIRLSGCDTAEFITTDGLVMFVIKVPCKHRFILHTFAVSLQEFEKVLMFEGPDLAFDDHLKVGTSAFGGAYIPLDKLTGVDLIDLETILGLQPNSGHLKQNFPVSKVSYVVKFCELIGEKDFTIEHTGKGRPIIFESLINPWKIYSMPIGENS